MGMCLRLGGDNAKAGSISNTFSFGIDILYAEVFKIIIIIGASLHTSRSS